MGGGAKTQIVPAPVVFISLPPFLPPSLPQMARGLVVGSLHPVDTVKIRVQMFGKAGLQVREEGREGGREGEREGGEEQKRMPFLFLTSLPPFISRQPRSHAPNGSSHPPSVLSSPHHHRQRLNLRALYAGLTSSLLGQMPYGMLVYGSYEVYKDMLQDR